VDELTRKYSTKGSRTRVTIQSHGKTAGPDLTGVGGYAFYRTIYSTDEHESEQTVHTRMYQRNITLLRQSQQYDVQNNATSIFVTGRSEGVEAWDNAKI
jgi:hypothetical protein